MDELLDINSYLNAQKKINWTKGLDIAMKNQVTNEYTYMERAEQVKLRGFFENNIRKLRSGLTKYYPAERPNVKKTSHRVTIQLSA